MVAVRTRPVVAAVLGAALVASCASGNGDPDVSSESPEVTAVEVAVEDPEADRDAQHELRAALVVVKAHYADEGTFSNVTPKTLEAIDSHFSFDHVEHADEDTIGIGDQSDTGVVLVTRSASGTWFCIADDVNSGTSYGTDSALDAVQTASECSQLEFRIVYNDGNRDLDAIDLGDEPELDPIESRFNAMILGDVDVWLAAYSAPECDIDRDTIAQLLDPVTLEVPMKADVADGGDDTVSVTVADSSGVILDEQVRFDGDRWLIDRDVCEHITELQNNFAKGEVFSALYSAKTHFSTARTYTTLTRTALEDAWDRVQYDTIANAGAGVVGLGDVSDMSFVVATKSKSGTWYCIADDMTSGTRYGHAGNLAAVDTVAECRQDEWAIGGFE